MSKFESIDDAVAAVNGTVNITVCQWDDGFTWSIVVTAYDQYEYEWDETDDACPTYTSAAIAACEFAIDAMAMDAKQEGAGDE